MSRFLIILNSFSVLLVFLLAPALSVSRQVFAQQTKQAVIINPVRGKDFWQHPYDILDTPKNEYRLIQGKKLPATWLVRYDALKDEPVLKFLKSLDQNQEVGLFLEVTPTFAQDAGVKYNQSANWHLARSVLLIGYAPDDRKKLIDTAVRQFKDNLGVDLKSVGAWWVDAFSLNYLHEKYGVEANLDVSDQYSTDDYQVWGQYWSSPFYPAKLNALYPAQSVEDKLGVVTIQWANRDPYNGYGNGDFDSTYSVQANDYLIHNLGSNYFEKLVEIYPEITIGLENDFSWKEYGNEYSKQIDILSKKQAQGILKLSSMSGFAKSYKATYPNLSPNTLIVGDDPLNSGGKVVWYQTPRYRVGLFYGTNGMLIRDLRTYETSAEEICYKEACQNLNLANIKVHSIDEVTFGSKYLVDEGQISDFKVLQKSDSVEVSYKNQAGNSRLIKFLANDIEINGKAHTLSSLIIDANVSQKDNIDNHNLLFKSEFNWGKNIPPLLINFFKFLLLIVLFFVIPGLLVSRNWLFSIPVGISLFTVISFPISFLHFDLLLWLIPLFCLAALLKKGIPEINFPRANINNILVGGVVILGSLSWLLTNIKNGLVFNYGLGYWGPNGHDGIWHLALISELQKNFPPQNPVFAGVALANYHYFYDLLLAKSANLLMIDPQDLLFRFFPLLISVFSGLLMLKVSQKLFGEQFDKKAKLVLALSSVFFLYFGGSFGWIVSYFRDKTFGGESMFWSQQAISTLLNPPFAISIVLFLTGLYFFTEYFTSAPNMSFAKFRQERFWKNINWQLALPIIFTWGSLIEFKAYGGVLVLIALGLSCLERVCFRQDFKLVAICILTFLVSALVFLPNNLNSVSLFVFSPLWLVFTMIRFEDRLNWQRLALTIDSGVPYKVFLGSIIASIIFFLGNFATRIVGFLSIKSLFAHRLLFYIFLLGCILPLIFIQKGTNWNIVQFFYYPILILSFLAGSSIAYIYKRLNLKIFLLISILIILLTIPTTLNVLSQYIPDRPPAKLSISEYQGLLFLKKQPPGTVLTFAFNPDFKKIYQEPKPLFAYESTAYVTAFSSQLTFLEDTVNLEILAVDYKARLSQQKDFVKFSDSSKEILKRNNISYVYLLKADKYSFDENKLGLKNIFENDEVKIFKAL